MTRKVDEDMRHNSGSKITNKTTRDMQSRNTHHMRIANYTSRNINEAEKKKKPREQGNVLDWDYATVEKINRNAQYMNTSAN
jgi:hypothetical protein